MKIKKKKKLKYTLKLWHCTDMTKLFWEIDCNDQTIKLEQLDIIGSVLYLVDIQRNISQRDHSHISKLWSK